MPGISVLIRIELYSSGNRIISPENQNFYNISLTLHGFLMIFFLVMPGLFGGFGNYFVPIFQGSPEVVYPRVNNFSILILWDLNNNSVILFLLCGFRILHLFYLHFLSSNNPLRNSTNNKIPFFPFIFQKDKTLDPGAARIQQAVINFSFLSHIVATSPRKDQPDLLLGGYWNVMSCYTTANLLRNNSQERWI